MNYLLAWFDELSSRRQSFGGEPNAITEIQILAWAAITGNRVRPEEVTVIFTMDATYRKTIREAAIKEAPSNG